MKIVHISRDVLLQYCCIRAASSFSAMSATPPYCLLSARARVIASDFSDDEQRTLDRQRMLCFVPPTDGAVRRRS
jgi:hypothetical protein